MTRLLRKIITEALGDQIEEVNPIENLGSVNEVYDVKGKLGNYIVRINGEVLRLHEYKKEKWCLEQVARLGVPLPNVIGIGECEGYQYLIQEKLPGVNGTKCTIEQRQCIWKDLGAYVQRYQAIKLMEVKEVNKLEFHKSWQSKLAYNIGELNGEDILLKSAVIDKVEQEIIRTVLQSLRDNTYNLGLVHGDLSLRNVIYNPDTDTTHLIDWGTASINIVPHVEIGILMMAGEIKTEALSYFLDGLGISKGQFAVMEKEINRIMLLERLDKYRWSVDHKIKNQQEYVDKLMIAFERVKVTSN